MDERRYIVKPDSPEHARTRTRTYKYENHAELEAKALCQELMMPVHLLRRDGSVRVYIETFYPKDRKTLLLEKKGQLERDLRNVTRMLEECDSNIHT